MLCKISEKPLSNTPQIEILGSFFRYSLYISWFLIYIFYQTKSYQTERSVRIWKYRWNLCAGCKSLQCRSKGEQGLWTKTVVPNEEMEHAIINYVWVKKCPFWHKSLFGNRLFLVQSGWTHSVSGVIKQQIFFCNHGLLLIWILIQWLLHVVKF